MKVEDLQIDSKIKSKLVELGIEELYPPQAEAVNKGLTTGQNMVIAIPTASGKTLAAILAVFSSLLKYPGSKAVYLAPLRALASEKYEEFREFGKVLGKKVAISTGDMEETSGWLGSADVIIATNEKFDSLIRHQVSWLNEIKVVVSDEIHLINDGHRGPVLEVVLTLLRRNLPECQLVALSATIINADEIADWLEAELILSTWRPVKLQEAVWSNGMLHFAEGKPEPAGDSKDGSGGYISLTTEMIEEGGQVLIFANTRRSAMATAELTGPQVFKKLTVTQQEKLLHIANNIRNSGEKTKIREKLASVVEQGVAFHHAGLISSHRKLVEQGFKDQLIKAIAATPTLAAGVNLPGRRVILRSLSRYEPPFGYTPIPILEYKQMAGRAGRPRYDPYGQAIILAKQDDEVSEYLDRYIRADTEEITSKLANEAAMRAHILAFIASEYVDSFDSAMDMLSLTFYGYQHGAINNFLVEESVNRVLDMLVDAKLISSDEPYLVTPFGKRVSELYLDPLSARLIKMGLEEDDSEDIEGIVYMQLLAMAPDIRTYNVRQKEMGELFDTAEIYSDDWLSSVDHFEEFGEELGTDIFLTTIKVAMTVLMWLDENSEDQIYDKFGVSSGDLHAMLERMEWLVYCGIEISKVFKWKHHRKGMENILKRMKYGVKEELLPLVAIRGVGRIRARVLFDAGYDSIERIKAAPTDAIANLPGFGRKIAKSIKEGLGIEEDDRTVTNEASRVQTSLSSFFD
ncbi:MAG: DEAD/DEAH box helicase [Candidatus Kariarchaeaceae archaeon]